VGKYERDPETCEEGRREKRGRLMFASRNIWPPAPIGNAEGGLRREGSEGSEDIKPKYSTVI